MGEREERRGVESEMWGKVRGGVKRAIYTWE